MSNKAHQNWTLVIFALCLGAIVTCNVGCASGWLYEPTDGMEQAIAAGKPAFGPDDWTVPKVFFHRGELTCSSGDIDGVLDGWHVPQVSWCITGLSAPSSILEGPAWIELSPIMASWSTSALCHEMGHASRFMRGIDGDQAHVSATFAPGGPVKQCDALVAEWEASLGGE